MSDDFSPADLDVRKSKPSFWRRLSFVWLVPLLALVVSLSVAYQSFANRGVEVEISFTNASGITAGETKIKYRDVTVGTVERVEFASDLKEVLIYARVEQSIAPYLDQDASFWVVRPDVSVRGISGLDTVLSGVYIEGDWNNEADVAQTSFVGLETAPLSLADQPGTEIVLRTTDGSALSVGAPVLHQGMEVGALGAPQLQADGQTVEVSAFINAPYDKLITSSTRFWDTAGFSISLGTAGVSLNVGSLASLLEGGVAFDTVVSGGNPIKDGQTFDLFGDEETARSSLFNDAGRPKLNVAVLFDGSVSGLAVGSEVRFQGIRIGQVTDLGAVVIDDPSAARVELRTVLAIEPGRLGLGEEATPQTALDLLATFVDQGLRARLVTGNILSGSLVVELVEVADSPPATLNKAAQPYPLIPTTASNITDVADQAEGVLNRINNLPIEDLMTAAIDLMDGANALVRSDGIMQTPEQVAGLIKDARGLIGSAEVQAIPAQVSQMVTGLQTSVAAINAIVAQVRDADVAGQIGNVVANVDSATQNLPEISRQVESLVTKANALQIEALLAQATSALDSIQTVAGNSDLKEVPIFVNQLLQEARDLIASGDMQALPGELRNVVAQVNTTVADLNAQDISTKLADAITAANSAAQNIDSASAQLPAISEQLKQLSEKANQMDLDTLAASATETLNSINTLVSSPSAQALPASLSSALDEVQLVLSDVREGGAINNVNAALDSANQAAQAIEQAAKSLPELSRQAGVLVTSTGEVLSTYGDRSRFNEQTLSTLRDIQAAADAVSALARQIQRNPNSLITGR